MDTFRDDLATAKIDEKDERGRVVVLHSLRHSLATMLAASKMPPALAMRIMRHRDIKLTMQAYTDEALLPLAAAMADLPSLGGERQEVQLRGTGTDNCANFVPDSGHGRASAGMKVAARSKPDATPTNRESPGFVGENLNKTASHSQGRQAPRLGLEPTEVVQQPSINAGLAEATHNDCAKNVPDSGPEDTEVAVIRSAWPTLPAAIRAGIVAMVKAAEGARS